MSDELEAGLEHQINAVDMKPGKVYLNKTGSVKVVLLEKKDGKVFVKAWYAAGQEWRTTSVEETYKVIVPTKGELIMTEQTDTTTKEKVKKERKVTSTAHLGKIRGLKMLATWGQVYKEVGEQGLEAVTTAMLEEFPDRAESINRWGPAYRIYYNTGRLPGVEKPATPILWETEKQKERVAKKQASAAIKQAKLDEKNAKKEAAKAAREQKKMERLAAAEAKLAEKLAKKEAAAEAKTAEVAQ